MSLARVLSDARTTTLLRVDFKSRNNKAKQASKNHVDALVPNHCAAYSCTGREKRTQSFRARTSSGGFSLDVIETKHYNFTMIIILCKYGFRTEPLGTSLKSRCARSETGSYHDFSTQRNNVGYYSSALSALRQNIRKLV